MFGYWVRCQSDLFFLSELVFFFRFFFFFFFFFLLFLLRLLFEQTVFRPDITVMVDWALNINYLSSFVGAVLFFWTFLLFSLAFLCLLFLSSSSSASSSPLSSTLSFSSSVLISFVDGTCHLFSSSGSFRPGSSTNSLISVTHNYC